VSIIIHKGGREVHKLEPSAIKQEELLQRYVLEHPESLPLEEIDETIQLIIVAREFPTPSGPIDALGIDQNGQLYIIETKLYKNPDKRTVIAQVLDYAAALWRSQTSGNVFLDELETRASALLKMPLAEALASSFSLDADNVADVLQSLQANVEQGAMRFILLMDKIDDRLKDLIRFVNENSRFTLYGVELEFYEHDEFQIVIPSLYGAELTKRVPIRGSGRRIWNEHSFFEDAAQKLSKDQLAAVRTIYHFALRTADTVSWGTGGKSGSFNPKYKAISPTRSIITVSSDGRLSLNFGWLTDTDTGERYAHELHDHVENRLGLELPDDYATSYPVLQIEQWAHKAEELIRALEESLRAVGAIA